MKNQCLLIPSLCYSAYLPRKHCLVLPCEYLKNRRWIKGEEHETGMKTTNLFIYFYFYLFASQRGCATSCSQIRWQMRHKLCRGFSSLVPATFWQVVATTRCGTGHPGRMGAPSAPPSRPSCTAMAQGRGKSAPSLCKSSRNLPLLPRGDTKENHKAEWVCWYHWACEQHPAHQMKIFPHCTLPALFWHNCMGEEWNSIIWSPYDPEI